MNIIQNWNNLCSSQSYTKELEDGCQIIKKNFLEKKLFWERHPTIPHICHKHHKRCLWREKNSYGEFFHVEKFLHMEKKLFRNCAWGDKKTNMRYAVHTMHTMHPPPCKNENIPNFSQQKNHQQEIFLFFTYLSFSSMRGLIVLTWYSRLERFDCCISQTARAKLCISTY